LNRIDLLDQSLGAVFDGEIREEDENSFDQFLCFRFGQTREDDDEDILELRIQCSLK
jgi:hypothetical protein